MIFWSNYCSRISQLSLAALGVLFYKKYKNSSSSQSFLTNVLCKHEIPPTDLDAAKRNLSLVNVQIFFRHGARTPIHVTPDNDVLPTPNWLPSIFLRRSSPANFPCYHFDLHGRDIPGDPQGLERWYQSNILSGGAPVGQLTRIGQEQMFHLGQDVRRRYVNNLNFISPEERPQEIVCRTTRLNRNIDSTICFLAGLYDMKTPKIEGYPRFYSIPSEEEILSPNPKACDLLKKLSNQGRNSVKKEEDVCGTKDKLKKLLKLDSIGTFTSEGKEELVFHIRDDLIAREVHGFWLPKEIQNLMSELSRASAKELYYSLFGGNYATNPSSVVFSTGPVIKLICDNFSAAKKNDSTTKVHLYATHDSLLIPLMITFGIFDGEWPKFGADVRLELYQDSVTGEFWIQFLYCGIPQCLTSESNNSPLVPLDIVEKKLKPFAINLDDYRKICHHTTDINDFSIGDIPSGM